MAGKKLTDEELSAMFEGIGTEDEPKDQSRKPSTAAAPAVTSEGASSDGNEKPTPTSSNDNDDDPLAEIKGQLAANPRPSSRASTPRNTSTAPSVHKDTPTSSRSARSSEEKAAQTQATQPQEPEQGESAASGGSGGGGWWGGFGGLGAMASAAVKQAQSAVGEIQKNEDARKFAEQVRGNMNVGALRGLGDDLRSRALPTFTSILHTLAPPISQHERLQIHTTHDLVNYPSLDPMIYQTFSRVMSQVEGGDLLVIQRGSESSQRRNSEVGYTGSGGSGWSDGPWWRQNDAKRSLGTVGGLNEGTKLVRVSAESYANEYLSSRGGLEEAAKSATVSLNESNPVRSSDIFLAIQPISYAASSELFTGATDQSAEEKTQDEKVVVDEPPKPDELVSFAIYLYDPVHSITFSTISQSFPQKWANWIDASSKSSIHDGSQFVPELPEEILEIIKAGGVDPREWVAEWMEECLSLAVGVVAQKYVARRMGVGEGGIGRGKRKEEAVESNAAEAARAGI
ncbi:MAG: hypothetical protein M1831_006559 [Alyxoria varia]|nr:MAG: hypothetical protein M1831_006559 [Alyxoria varia]